MVAAEEPLLKKDIQMGRLTYVYGSLIDTPEARQLGVGAINDERLKSSIATISLVVELPRRLDAAQVFDGSFLPPNTERLPPIINP